MIKAACEKREVLKVMASDYLNKNKANFLIEDEEWEFIKIFADELSTFRETTQVFSKSKSITSPNVSGLYGLLVERLGSLSFLLNDPLRDFTWTKMSNDQAKVLRCAYTSMKEKLLKYEIQMRRKPMFPIAIVLDPRFKLKHILPGEHKFFMETLLNMLESVRIVEALSSMPIDDLLASTTRKHSKLMMQFMERQSSRSTTVDEKSVKVELEDYLCEPCIDCLHDDSL